jgi:3-hydroxyisobutyrate dehydrogenase-like beta-hydroxyacid dehydrogenase
MEIKNVGFIGIGNMGFPMAKHLLEAGYKVNISKHSNREESLKRIKVLGDLGANTVDEIYEIPLGVDLIITILPTDKEIREVLLNEEFYNNVGKDTMILEMTSCSPDVVMEVEEYYRRKDVKVIDAPVSGGVKGAVNGTLTIFGSGEESTFKDIEKVLDVFSKKVYYVGALGSGKTLKSINQIMIAMNTLGVIEAFSVANKNNIDLDIMNEIIRESSGNSYAFQGYFNKIRNEEFEDGFKLKLMRKDLNTALKIGEDLPLPVSNLIHEMFLMGKKYDELDFSSISKLYNLKD